jgi:hypothetical protein
LRRFTVAAHSRSGSNAVMDCHGAGANVRVAPFVGHWAVLHSVEQQPASISPTISATDFIVAQTNREFTGLASVSARLGRAACKRKRRSRIQRWTRLFCDVLPQCERPSTRNATSKPSSLAQDRGEATIHEDAAAAASIISQRATIVILTFNRLLQALPTLPACGALREEHRNIRKSDTAASALLARCLAV